MEKSFRKARKRISTLESPNMTKKHKLKNNEDCNKNLNNKKRGKEIKKVKSRVIIYTYIIINIIYV